MIVNKKISTFEIIIIIISLPIYFICFFFTFSHHSFLFSNLFLFFL